jgi:hypothetical protein
LKPIFISYRRAWTAEVEQLAATLRLRGLQVFTDLSDPSALTGASTFDALRRTIREDCSAFLLYVTRDIPDSSTVRDLEVVEALDAADRDPRFLLLPFYRDISPSEVRDSMAPHGLRLSAANGVVAIPPPGVSGVGPGAPDVGGDALHAWLEARRRDAARLLLDHVLRSTGPVARIGIQTRATGPSAGDFDLLLDWSSAYPDGHAEPAGCASAHAAITDVVERLGRTATRRLAVFPKAHLSAGVLLGAAFPRPSGFTLDIDQNGEVWSSARQGKWQPGDAADAADDPSFLRFVPRQLDPSSKDIALIVAISRPETVAAADAAMAAMGIKLGGRIVVEPREGASRRSIPSAAAARATAEKLAQTLMDARKAWGIGVTHVFIAAPFALAVLIGHELNGLGPLCIYEHVKDQPRAADSYRKAFEIR